MPPFFFWDLGLSFLSLLQILSRVDCLSPLQLVFVLAFYLAYSSGTSFSAILSDSLRVQLPFDRLQGCSSSCFCCWPPGRWGCLRGAGFRLWGLTFAHRWVEVGRAVSGGVFSGQLCVQEDIEQSVSWWGGCMPTLLIIWPEASQHWRLQAFGWGQVLVRKWQPSRGLVPMKTPQNYHCQCPCPRSEPQPSPPPPQ